jgi:hypothetical protein
MQRVWRGNPDSAGVKEKLPCKQGSIKILPDQTEWGCLLKGVKTWQKNKFSLVREKE